MLKITDNEYSLPEIEALSSFGTFETGTTQPMKILGVDMKTGKRDELIVKFFNSTRMSMKSSCRELIGAWMAKQVDINVVEPAIVNISEKFVETLNGAKGYASALKSVGINFASFYNAGYFELILPNHKFDNNLIEQVKKIFVFDMLIQNADRGAGKPNVLTNSEKLLIFDHELAFSFCDLFTFRRNNEPWKIDTTLNELYSSHIFYQLLRNSEQNFEKEVECLNQLDNRFWEKVESMIPTIWKSEEIEDIKKHTLSIIENLNLFKEELERILKI